MKADATLFLILGLVILMIKQCWSLFKHLLCFIDRGYGDIPESMRDMIVDGMTKGYMRTAIGSSLDSLEMSKDMLTRFGITLPHGFAALVEALKAVDYDTMTYRKMKELEGQMQGMLATLQTEMNSAIARLYGSRTSS